MRYYRRLLIVLLKLLYYSALPAVETLINTIVVNSNINMNINIDSNINNNTIVVMTNMNINTDSNINNNSRGCGVVRYLACDTAVLG